MADTPRPDACDPRPAWTPPRLRRIGSVRDIAQRDSPLNQAFQDKRS